jgi:hypothetical protein
MPVQKDAAGIIIELTVTEDGQVVNLNIATRLDMVFKRPVVQTSFSRTGVLTTDGTDGKYRYVTTSADLNEAGLWEIQGDLAFGVFDGRTSVRTFAVEENL